MPKLSASSRPPRSRGAAQNSVPLVEQDWEAARLETLALVAAHSPYGGDLQPGDITAHDYAEAAGLSASTARGELARLTEQGVLVRVDRVRDPRSESGQRVTVWRPVKGG